MILEPESMDFWYMIRYGWWRGKTRLKMVLRCSAEELERWQCHVSNQEGEGKRGMD